MKGSTAKQCHAYLTTEKSDHTATTLLQLNKSRQKLGFNKFLFYLMARSYTHVPTLHAVELKKRRRRTVSRDKLVSGAIAAAFVTFEPSDSTVIFGSGI